VGYPRPFHLTNYLGPMLMCLCTGFSGPCAFVPGAILIFAWPKNMATFQPAPLKHLDYIGAILMLGGTVLLVFILNQAAIREYAWDSGATIAVLIISILCLLSLVLWQRFVSRNRNYRHIRAQFPFEIMSDRVLMLNFTYVVATQSPFSLIFSTKLTFDSTTLFTGFVMMLTIINVPLRSQIVNFYDAVHSGILLLPLMGSMALGSMTGGMFSAKKNNSFWTSNAASCLMLMGSGLLSTLGDTSKPERKEYGFQVILGLGLGLNMSTATFVTSLQSQFEHHGWSHIPLFPEH